MATDGKARNCIDFQALARVVEPVDTRDLKSLGGNPVRVRIPPRASGETATSCAVVAELRIRRLDSIWRDRNELRGCSRAENPAFGHPQGCLGNTG